MLGKDKDRMTVSDFEKIDEKTYDGYVAIMEANGVSREEQMEKMRKARIANRKGGDRVEDDGKFEGLGGDRGGGGGLGGGGVGNETIGARDEGGRRGKIGRAVGWGRGWIVRLFGGRRR